MALTVSVFDLDTFAHLARERLFARSQAPAKAPKAAAVPENPDPPAPGPGEPEFHGQWHLLRYL